jgi:hypothetical protein
MRIVWFLDVCDASQRPQTKAAQIDKPSGDYASRQFHCTKVGGALQVFALWSRLIAGLQNGYQKLGLDAFLSRPQPSAVIEIDPAT